MLALACRAEDGAGKTWVPEEKKNDDSRFTYINERVMFYQENNLSPE